MGTVPLWTPRSSTPSSTTSRWTSPPPVAAAVSPDGWRSGCCRSRGGGSSPAHPARVTGWPTCRADPRLTLHLKESAAADLPARAVEVTDASIRRLVLTHAVARWYRSQHDVDGLVADAPMVELFFEQGAGAE